MPFLAFTLFEIAFKYIFASVFPGVLLTPAVLVYASYHNTHPLWVISGGLILDALGAFQFGFFTITFVLIYGLVQILRNIAQDTIFSKWFFMTVALVAYHALAVWFTAAITESTIFFTQIAALLTAEFIRQQIVLFVLFGVTYSLNSYAVVQRKTKSKTSLA